MSECNPDLSTAEKVLSVVRLKEKSNVPMATPYEIDCPHCKASFKMLTHEFHCPGCDTIAVVVPCHADDPRNIQFVKA